jgi:hypothetical protein
MSTIQLGDEVKDKVSGFSGIAIGRIEYINGCIQFGIKSKVKKTGELPKDNYWVDEKELDIVKKGAVKIEMKRTGGDMPKIRNSNMPSAIHP